MERGVDDGVKAMRISGAHVSEMNFDWRKCGGNGGKRPTYSHNKACHLLQSESEQD